MDKVAQALSEVGEILARWCSDLDEGVLVGWTVVYELVDSHGRRALGNLSAGADGRMLPPHTEAGLLFDRLHRYETWSHNNTDDDDEDWVQ